eukprot:4020657-Prymnesium_polylepis.1
MLRTAVVRDDTALLSLLLAARVAQPLSLERHVMQLLADAAAHDAAACALMLCNRMLTPEARLRPATEAAPHAMALFVSVAPVSSQGLEPRSFACAGRLIGVEIPARTGIDSPRAASAG